MDVLYQIIFDIKLSKWRLWVSGLALFRDNCEFRMDVSRKFFAGNAKIIPKIGLEIKVDEILKCEIISFVYNLDFDVRSTFCSIICFVDFYSKMTKSTFVLNSGDFKTSDCWRLAVFCRFGFFDGAFAKLTFYGPCQICALDQIRTFNSMKINSYFKICVKKYIDHRNFNIFFIFLVH